MNGWFLAAGVLLIGAFFVHMVSGNRFYSTARPDRGAAGYPAWLMGRCGMQMIGADLALAAAMLLALGLGAVPRNFFLELLLTLLFGCWTLAWLAALIWERASGRHSRRLCHWVLFLVLTVLLSAGMCS